MPFNKPNKGSVLVFSLIVLSIVLSAALSVAVVNVSNRKSAGSTGQSVQSFQVADSGVEKTLKEIYKGSYTDLNAMAGALSSSCTPGSGKFAPFNVSGGTASVTFFNTNNQPIECTSPTWRDDVAKIKVEGTSAGTTRVIETAVAAANACAWKTIDSGGTQEVNHVRYTDGADHSPNAVCVKAGYHYYSGACRFVDASDRHYQGSVLSNQQTYFPNWGITCLYGQGSYASYFFSNRDDSEVLCCK